MRRVAAKGRKGGRDALVRASGGWAARASDSWYEASPARWRRGRAGGTRWQKRAADGRHRPRTRGMQHLLRGGGEEGREGRAGKSERWMGGTGRGEGAGSRRPGLRRAGQSASPGRWSESLWHGLVYPVTSCKAVRGPGQWTESLRQSLAFPVTPCKVIRGPRL
jgi:hypothetical protein